MFKKGQKVHCVGSWNDKGTYYVQECVVEACGKKHMVLSSAATGECVGRFFTPAIEQKGGSRGGIVFSFVKPNMTLDEAKAFAVEKAEFYRQDRLTNLRECIVRHAEQAGYVKAVQSNIAGIEANPAAVVVLA